ncbi:hypothetical protein FGO68_gene9196 [Halteria grandinella]|uniref:Uncharacterized protein n=1 Tax=Halteria grandinella TaxID=5974 RepID=A0A8J8NWQ8_HALGN|nr:hypothetical protein FGO68_gene9196 [Halteria grandinella]
MPEFEWQVKMPQDHQFNLEYKISICAYIIIIGEKLADQIFCSPICNRDQLFSTIDNLSQTQERGLEEADGILNAVRSERSPYNVRYPPQEVHLVHERQYTKHPCAAVLADHKVDQEKHHEQRCK